jgi:hypothetical protein
MPILDANGRPMQAEQVEDAERTRTMMKHLPIPHEEEFAEGTGQNVQKMCQQVMPLNPVSALVLMAQTTGVLFNSINWTTIEEKVEAEKLMRSILDNAIANGDDFENPAPALMGNALLSPATH